MRTLQRMADGLIARFVPGIKASADGYEYSCFGFPCSTNSSRTQRWRRYCHAGSCYSWEIYGCCL